MGKQLLLHLLHKGANRADDEGDVVEPSEVDVAEEADHLPNDLALAILNYAVVATFLIIYFMMLKMMLVNYRQKSENKDVMTQKMSEKLWQNAGACFIKSFTDNVNIDGNKTNYFLKRSNTGNIISFSCLKKVRIITRTNDASEIFKIKS